MRGLINPSFDSALSVVGMDHDIDEPARARLHLGQRLTQIDAGSTSNLNNRGWLIQSRLNAMLLRANYTLLDRYLFTGSVRRGGSSRFGPESSTRVSESFAEQCRLEVLPEKQLEKRVAELEEKLARKDGVIAEILEEHVKLKKELGES